MSKDKDEGWSVCGTIFLVIMALTPPVGWIMLAFLALVTMPEWSKKL